MAAAAVAILIAGTFWSDALDYFIDLQFNKIQRAQVQVGFFEAASGDVRRYVGPADIMMLHSVADVQGLVRISDEMGDKLEGAQPPPLRALFS